MLSLDIHFPQVRMMFCEKPMQIWSIGMTAKMVCPGPTCCIHISQTRADLIDAYLNGPRTLSNVRLSYLIISPSTTLQSVTPPPTPSDDTPAFDFGSISPIPHDLLVCATHFLGDGMSLHQFANDFFSLLGCGMSGKQLREMLENQWQAQRCQVSDRRFLPKRV